MHATSRSPPGGEARGASSSEGGVSLQGSSSNLSPLAEPSQDAVTSSFASSFSTAARRPASSAAPLSSSASLSFPNGSAHSSRSFLDDSRPRSSVFSLLPPSACRAISYLLVAGLSLSALTSLALHSHVAVLQILLFGISVSYCIAFLSLARQADGLIGPQVGVLPLDEHLPVLQQRARVPASPHIKFLMKAVHQVATLVCRNKHNVLPSHLAYGGVAVAIFCAGLSLTSTGWPRALWQTACFAALYVEYLAFRYMARDFLSFQWDVLLLESGFIAVCAAPCSTEATPFAAGVSVMCLRLLAFKLLFCSGVCKFASGDQKWSTFTAMHYHYWTQPLPNFISWHAYWSGNKRVQAIAAVTLEILGPLLILFGRGGRIVALVCFVVMMTAIYVTGNYGFFNFLSSVICVALLDDSLLLFKFAAPLSNASVLQRATESLSAVLLGCVAVSFYILFSLTSVALFLKLWQKPLLEPPALCTRIYGELAPLHACNVYGLFASVTTSRYEVVIEEMHLVEDTSTNPPRTRETWVELDFHYKPGDVDRRPPWLWFGHMPRLDWRLWFLPLRLSRVINMAIRDGASPSAVSAALQQGAPGLYPAWWSVLLARICRRQPEVLALLGPQRNIDLTRAPCPRGLRVSLFDFRFRPPPNRPLYAAFFPEGTPALSPQEIQEIELLSASFILEIGGRWAKRKPELAGTFRASPPSQGAVTWGSSC
ncbi:unnamed protein product [Neospora caninum Liverpool]|uniref:Lipase maturation factor 2 n=1 Tax=Neospora caninum (strain Liverpool) TaxID=572307 RepID=F0V8R3_NEOCL|nr:uncharacterized protein NCLIV_005800 [Neospora caninum Liverpool]CBZ50104.1 unnamed protein product [Neospora caninum Liverpool]|eukprot:XP_003880139.1 uncharacterized protein NCLIV_005800 [Neospora caninum Liverpool]